MEFPYASNINVDQYDHESGHDYEYKLDIHSNSTSYIEIKFGHVFYPSHNIYLTGEIGLAKINENHDHSLHIKSGHEINAKAEAIWPLTSWFSLGASANLYFQKQDVRNDWNSLDYKIKRSNYSLGLESLIRY